MRLSNLGTLLWVCPCVYLQVLYFFPPNKYFTCLTIFHLCGNSFLQSSRARALVTDHWSSGWDLVLSQPQSILSLWLGTEALLQAVAGQGHLRSYPLTWELIRCSADIRSGVFNTTEYLHIIGIEIHTDDLRLSQLPLISRRINLSAYVLSPRLILLEAIQ